MGYSSTASSSCASARRACARTHASTNSNDGRTDDRASRDGDGAVDEAARELRFLEKLLTDFGVQPPRPTALAQDNKSTVTLVGSTHWNARTRHVALRYHSTGDLQRAGVLQVRYLPTE